MKTLLVLLISVCLTSALAHEGHDHGAPPPPIDASTAPRVDAYSDTMEAVAVRADKEILIYLDRFEDNTPIDGAQIEVDGPGGTVKAAFVRDGVYKIPAPFVETPGSYPLTLTVAAGSRLDLLSMTLVIPDPAAGTGSRRFLDMAKRQPDGSLFVPKTTQRLFGLRTRLIENGTHAKAVEWPGKVIADPNASGLVQSPVTGRLRAPEGGFPRLGTNVKQGQPLAYLIAVMSLAEASDLRQRTLEIEQQLMLAKRKQARIKPVADILPRQQVEEVEIEVKALEGRLKALKQAVTEGEPLRAPVSGIVAAANAATGQVVEPNTMIFTILDPQKLWVETQSFDPVQTASIAAARTNDGRTFPLAFRGSGLAGPTQTVPAHFAVEGTANGLRLGQMVTVTAKMEGSRSGIPLPRSSIVRGPNGQNLVFEHTAPERFEPRPIRFEPLDSEHVLVVSGLEGKKRIVAQGAELLAQVR